MTTGANAGVSRAARSSSSAVHFSLSCSSSATSRKRRHLDESKPQWHVRCSVPCEWHTNRRGVYNIRHSKHCTRFWSGAQTPRPPPKHSWYTRKPDSLCGRKAVGPCRSAAHNRSASVCVISPHDGADLGSTPVDLSSCNCSGVHREQYICRSSQTRLICSRVKSVSTDVSICGRHSLLSPPTLKQEMGSPSRRVSPRSPSTVSAANRIGGAVGGGGGGGASPSGSARPLPGPWRLRGALAWYVFSTEVMCGVTTSMFDHPHCSCSSAGACHERAYAPARTTRSGRDRNMSAEPSRVCRRDGPAERAPLTAGFSAPSPHATRAKNTQITSVSHWINTIFGTIMILHTL